MSTETEVKGGVGGTGWKNSETEEEMSMKQEDSECHKTTKATKQRKPTNNQKFCKMTIG